MPRDIGQKLGGEYSTPEELPEVRREFPRTSEIVAKNWKLMELEGAARVR
jgi:hypothetical protein